MPVASRMASVRMENAARGVREARTESPRPSWESPVESRIDFWRPAWTDTKPIARHVTRGPSQSRAMRGGGLVDPFGTPLDRTFS